MAISFPAFFVERADACFAGSIVGMEQFSLILSTLHLAPLDLYRIVYM